MFESGIPRFWQDTKQPDDPLPPSGYIPGAKLYTFLSLSGRCADLLFIRKLHLRPLCRSFARFLFLTPYPHGNNITPFFY